MKEVAVWEFNRVKDWILKVEFIHNLQVSPKTLNTNDLLKVKLDSYSLAPLKFAKAREFMELKITHLLFGFLDGLMILIYILRVFLKVIASFLFAKFMHLQSLFLKVSKLKFFVIC